MREITDAVENRPSPDGDEGFVGSWSVTVFETDGPPTRALFTLGAGGTLVTAEHPVVTPPGAGAIFTSSGHGAWRASGPNEAVFTCIGLGSDGNGNLFAMVTYRGSLSLGADRYTVTGELTATLEDPKGTTMAMFLMTLEGTRIVAETVSASQEEAGITSSAG